MSIFQNTVITSEGAALIRNAVSQSKQIVITRAKCGSHYDMDSISDLAAKPIAWFDGTDGTVTGSTQTDFGARIVISFSAVSGKDDPVKSVGICAQIKKDGVSPTYNEGDDVLLALACDDNSNFTNKKAFSVSFDLPINQFSGYYSIIEKKGDAGGEFVLSRGANKIIGDLSVSDDGTTTTRIAGTVDIFDAVETTDTAISLTNTELSVFPDGLGDSESSTAFPWTSMPLSATFNTDTSKIVFILGDGRSFEVTVDAIQEI